VFDRVSKWWRGRRVPPGREEELRRLERRLAKIRKREERRYRRQLRDERILLKTRFFGEGRPHNKGGWERMENKLSTRRDWQWAAFAVSVSLVLIAVLELLHVH
jgi:hypothetical protein